ncbi:MAG TPA: alpha/beta fold hydrolase [Polyangiaceae bacterium]|nr:alpha/beta fold hydrolase [Polyangiaceae bacterium]
MDQAHLLAAAGRVAASAIARPRPLLRSAARLARELSEITLGRSTRAPAPSDRRFVDVAFRENAVYRRLMQSYLAFGDALLALPSELELDAKSQERGRLALSLVADALAPTNTLVGNPAAVKRAFETAGMSLARGMRNLARDVVDNRGMPAQIAPGAYRVGENLAVTAGAVVLRTEVLELLQYSPRTDAVYERPLLMVPPQINKYYVLDLAPGRSLVEYAVSKGFTVFVVSWRNPTPAQRDWGMDTYVGALCEVVDAVCAVTGSERLNVLGACAGGITTAVLLGHLAARGDARVGAATFPVTVLDTSATSPFSVHVTEKTIASALARSRSKGVLTGREMSRAFAWLRPNDLVWNYWVNNYLLGQSPPSFDILFWNNDVTNLPAALHAEFLELLLKNSLCHPGALSALGTPVDLTKVRAEVYAVGALTDHITPWQACYRTPRLFGGARTFVESSSGHIQALVNPPGSDRAAFLTCDTYEADEAAWLKAARKHQGSWWDHWASWLSARSGGQRESRETLGNDAYPPLGTAPGRYVHQHA